MQLIDQVEKQAILSCVACGVFYPSDVVVCIQCVYSACTKQLDGLLTKMCQTFRQMIDESFAITQ